MVWVGGIIIFFGYMSVGMGWEYLHLLWVFVRWYGVVVSSSSFGICQMVWVAVSSSSLVICQMVRGGGIIIFYGHFSNGMGGCCLGIFQMVLGGGISIFFGHMSDGMG